MSIIDKWIDAYGGERYDLLFNRDWSVYEITFRHNPNADISIDYWNSDNVVQNCGRTYASILESEDESTAIEWINHYKEFCKPFDKLTINGNIGDTFRARLHSLYGNRPIEKLNVPELFTILFPAFPNAYDDSKIVHRVYMKALGRVYGDSDLRNLYQCHYEQMTSAWNTMLEAEHNPKTDSYRFKFICPNIITKLLKTIGLLYKCRMSISRTNFISIKPNNTDPMTSGGMNSVSLYRLGDNNKDYSYGWYLSYSGGVLDACSDSDFFPNYMFTPFEAELIIAKILFANDSLKMHKEYIDKYYDGVKLLSAFMDNHKNACVNEFVGEGA